MPPAVLASLPSTLRLDPNASWVHEKEKEAQALPDGLALVRGLQMEAATMVAIGEGRTGQLFSILAQDHELEDPVLRFRNGAFCEGMEKVDESCISESARWVQELNLSGCTEIPAEAWQQLGKANWTKLRYAFFVGYLGSGIGPKVGAHDVEWFAR